MNTREKTKKETQEEKKKAWPNDRGIDEVVKLHAYNTEKTLTSVPNKLDILFGLPDDPVIIDQGMGQGNFLIEMAAKLKALKKKATLIGVSASPKEVKKDQCRYAGINLVEGALPHDASVMTMLKGYQGRADRVFDTFGAATYAQNPLHSLILSALLLKQGGRFSAISSTDNNFHTMFGDEKNRDKIIEFFKTEMNIDISFQFTSINSRVTPGQINTDLLISFTRGADNLTAKDYLHLCKKVDKVVGVPFLSREHKSWYQYEGFSISPREYSMFAKFPELPQRKFESDEELLERCASQVDNRKKF